MNDVTSRGVPERAPPVPSGWKSSSPPAAILMVDDQPARLLSYEAILGNLQVRCVRALSGIDALARLMKEEFAAILLDVNMPGMDGFEVARLVREHPRYERTPIIFITGVNVTELDQLRGYEVGAIDYISVPVVPEILRTKVAILVELYQRRAELRVVNEALKEARARIELDHATALAQSRLTEETLRIRERVHQAVVENAPVGVCHTALSGHFQYINKAFCDLVGYSSEELAALTWQEITHPDDLEPARTLAHQVTTGEIPHYRLDQRYLRKDGSAVWVNFFGNFVYDDTGQPLHAVGLAVDITERKRVEMALRDREERLVLAHSAARLGTYDYDVRKGTIQWDERTCQLWGVSLSECVTYEVFLSGVHPDDLAPTKAALKRALDPAGDPHYDATFRVCNRIDGLTRWIKANGRALFERGEPLRLVGTVEDITERQQSEERIRESERRLRELSDHKDRFLAMLAHELRNPVAPIRSAAEVLSRTATPGGSEQSMVGIIQRQAQQLSRLLDDLLDVARITQGRIELRREPITLSTCVQIAVESIEPLIREKGHHVTVSHAAPSLTVNADKVRLTQCVSNLLINAAKYTDPGGRIDIRTFAEEQDMVIEVHDDGIGMSADLLPRVFELFVQNDASLDRSQGGLGLGLSICKQLIEMHGGRVAAVSAGAGLGSTFSIRLPIQSHSPAPEADRSTREISTRRVLIVDDNQDAADSLAMLLGSGGHEVRAVYASEDALTEAMVFAPDVVLLDIGLPHVDGYEVARRLKAASVSATLVALSGYGRPEDQQKSAAAGFDAHLVKPVDLQSIEDILARTG
jgi:PAS domain S-box-containing protein